MKKHLTSPKYIKWFIIMDSAATFSFLMLIMALSAGNFMTIIIAAIACMIFVLIGINKEDKNAFLKFWVNDEGIHNKYYSIKPVHNGNFEIMDGVYLIGDGSGITRGLSQSGAMGLYVADHIYGKIED